MDLAWQCSCGKIEYTDMEPDECLSCGKIGSFSQLPEELLDERMKEQDLDDDEFDIEKEMRAEMGMKPVKAKSGRSKPKLKKPGRKKR
jgi:hypothetical protein